MVNVINAGSGGAAALPPLAVPQAPPIFTPLILASSGIGLPQKFSGKISDWFSFKSEWENWVRTMSAQNGSDDPLVFAHLAQVLDDGERAQLQMLRELNPHMSYADYWVQLVREKERFSGQVRRQRLEALSLDPQGKLTSSKAKEYTANFERLAVQIPRLPDEEAIRIILRQVPKFLAEPIMTEITRRRSKHKVKVGGLVNVEVAALKALLEELLQAPPKNQCQRTRIFCGAGRGGAGTSPGGSQRQGHCEPRVFACHTDV